MLVYVDKKRSKNEKHRRNPNSNEEPTMQNSNNHIWSYKKQNQARKGSIEIQDKEEEVIMITLRRLKPETPKNVQGRENNAN